jgi:hypothetical protein
MPDPTVPLSDTESSRASDPSTFVARGIRPGQAAQEPKHLIHPRIMLLAIHDGIDYDIEWIWGRALVLFLALDPHSRFEGEM